MDDIELLDFCNYLKFVEEEIYEELKPYYERISDREESGMNTYGLCTPSDSVLLHKSAAICDLNQKAKESTSFEDLKRKLNEMVNNSQDSREIYQIKMQLDYIDKYLTIKQMKNSSDNSSDNQVKSALK